MLQGLPLIDNENEYYLFSYNDLEIQPQFYKNIATGRAFLPEKIFSAYWLNFILPKYLQKFNIDIFINPNHFLPIRKNLPKSIIVVHDIAHKENNFYHPFFYRIYMGTLLPVSLNRCSKIITISNYSKKSIIDKYKISNKKIDVIYRNANYKFTKKNISFSREEFLRNKYKILNPFVLYVGAIENRKNIIGILRIAELIKVKKIELDFLLIGRHGHGFKKINSEILKLSYVHHIQNVLDEELVDIYNIAFAFLFPSFFEGFGLPPLEAMQTGLPVLVSNRSSLPEVVGESGIIKNPDDYSGFADELIKMYNNKQYYEELRNKSVQRSSRFNYMDSLNRFVSLLKTIN